MKTILLFANFLLAIFCLHPDHSFSQVTDKDGNVYKTVTIGNQEWTSENLNVEHYRNGDAIPQVQDYEKWAKLKTGAWCWYENNSANGKTYGKLYNWYAVNDKRGLTPEGWHIATDLEWAVMVEKIGGEKKSGDKLKSTSGWLENNLATNSSGFSALPGGIRDADGTFYDAGKFACFWTSSEANETSAVYRFLIYNYTDVALFDGVKERGLSVRLIKD
ncbi:MAG: FISUMP domain-containing protein [Ignavibacteria bacterium]